MRTVIQPQLKLGEMNIVAIVIEPKSRDDIPQLLRGLQYIYTEPALRERIFAILKDVLPERVGAPGKASVTTGRSRYGALEDPGAGCTAFRPECRLRPHSRIGQSACDNYADIYRNIHILFFTRNLTAPDTILAITFCQIYALICCLQ